MRGPFTLLKSLFFLLILNTTPVLSQYGGAWQPAIEKDNIDVYIHRSQDLRVRGFKATTTIYLPFDSLETIFDDVAAYPEWQTMFRNTKVVHRVSDSKFHFYARTNQSWPAKNHDLMWRVEKEWDSRDGSLVYNQVCSSNTLPEKIKNGTIMQAFASWRLKPISEDEIEVTFYLMVDKGGRIPSWLINLLSPDNPHEILSNLKSRGWLPDGELALD